MAEKESSDTTGTVSRGESAELLRAVGGFFREHPAIAGSLLYLQVTTVGVVYSWSLFRRFDINIFDYAETNDFLLAAFKDLFVFGMSILSLVGAISFWLFLTVKRRQIRLIGEVKSTSTSATVSLTVGPAMAFASLLAGLAYTILIPYFFADIKADTLLHGPTDEPLATVQYRATSGSNEQTTTTGLRVIGTTQSFVFFYDREDARTLVIPTAQIVEMEHDGPKGKLKERK